MPQAASIAVIGAGIGGTAAALNLLRAGFDVHVYEQARALREVGAGIQISPNASRVIHHLGLGEALAKLGVRPLAFHQRRWQDGRTLLKSPLGDAVLETFGCPYYQVHRGDLLTMLTAALPQERLHVGHKLATLADSGDGVALQFENGEERSADIVIGADGIHSAVRHALFGAEQPRYSGGIAYRGLIPAERLRHLDIEVTTQIWMGPRGHVVVYFVAGKRYLNFVANADRDASALESWVQQGDPNELRATYAGWDPKLLAILDAVTETFIWGIFERVPLPRWSVGRVTLLGDACHPTLPFLAQGANMAIEDALVLARCLKAFDVPAALQRFHELRGPRTAAIVRGSAANATRFHNPALADPATAAAFVDREWEPERIRKRYDWLFEYDAINVPLTATDATSSAAIREHEKDQVVSAK